MIASLHFSWYPTLFSFTLSREQRTINSFQSIKTSFPPASYGLFIGLTWSLSGGNSRQTAHWAVSAVMLEAVESAVPSIRAPLPQMCCVPGYRRRGLVHPAS